MYEQEKSWGVFTECERIWSATLYKNVPGTHQSPQQPIQLLQCLETKRGGKKYMFAKKKKIVSITFEKFTFTSTSQLYIRGPSSQSMTSPQRLKVCNAT